MPGVVLGQNRMGYTFSQSALNKFRQCPEQARRIWFGEVDDFPGDKALRGIIAHAGISDWMINQDPESVPHALESAWQQEMMDGHPDITDEHLAQGAEAMQRWLEAFPMTGVVVRDVRTEAMFNLEVRPGLNIMGSRDVVHSGGVLDWKFSSARHWFTEAWKHQRYDIQPTVYLAVTAIEQQRPIEDLEFSYVIISDREFKVIPVRRTLNDVRNLHREMESIIDLCEALPQGPWPMNSSDWHCSPAWCPVFAKGECMGEHPAGWITAHKDPQYVNWLNSRR